MDRYIKPTLFVIWLSIVSFAIYSFLKSGLSIGELIAEFRDRIHNYDPWTPIIYVCILFPSQPSIFPGVHFNRSFRSNIWTMAWCFSHYNRRKYQCEYLVSSWSLFRFRPGTTPCFGKKIYAIFRTQVS